MGAEDLLHLGDKTPVEIIHLKFCRFILGVNRKATNIAVRAELGRRPLLVDLVVQSAKYWLHLVTPGSGVSGLVNDAYIDMHRLHKDMPNWASHICNVWNTFALSEVWTNHGTKYRHKIKRVLQNNIANSYDEYWLREMNRGDSKLRVYKDFKQTVNLENYLVGTYNRSVRTKRREFTKLRISAHQLRIETGRYSRPKTPVERRICQYCDSQSVETEAHALLNCSRYSGERDKFIMFLDTFSDFSRLNTDEDKFLFIMSYNNGDVEVAKVVQDYVYEVMEKRKGANDI